MRKYVIMRLMCDLELDKRVAEQRFNISFDSHFERSIEALQQFVDDGLVETTPDTISLRRRGSLAAEKHRDVL